MAGIELRNVRKSYGEVDAIRDVSLTIKEGEFVVLWGRRVAGSQRCYVASPGSNQSHRVGYSWMASM